MKEKMRKLLERASVDSVEKRASNYFWGEKEIPKVILDEIESRKKK